jgi:hypothetical protein
MLSALFDLLRSGPVQPVQIAPPALARVISDVLPITRQHQLTVYNPAYLELSLRHRAPLAALDDELCTAAKESKDENSLARISIMPTRHYDLKNWPSGCPYAGLIKTIMPISYICASRI